MFHFGFRLRMFYPAERKHSKECFVSSLNNKLHWFPEHFNKRLNVEKYDNTCQYWLEGKKIQMSLPPKKIFLIHFSYEIREMNTPTKLRVFDQTNDSTNKGECKFPHKLIADGNKRAMRSLNETFVFDLNKYDNRRIKLYETRSLCFRNS